jgi:hypothetical protein
VQLIRVGKESNRLTEHAETRQQVRLSARPIPRATLPRVHVASRRSQEMVHRLLPQTLGASAIASVPMGWRWWRAACGAVSAAPKSDVMKKRCAALHDRVWLCGRCRPTIRPGPTATPVCPKRGLSATSGWSAPSVGGGRHDMTAPPRGTTDALRASRLYVQRSRALEREHRAMRRPDRSEFTSTRDGLAPIPLDQIAAAIEASRTAASKIRRCDLVPRCATGEPSASLPTSRLRTGRRSQALNPAEVDSERWTNCRTGRPRGECTSKRRPATQKISALSSRTRVRGDPRDFREKRSSQRGGSSIRVTPASSDTGMVSSGRRTPDLKCSGRPDRTCRRPGRQR